MSESVSYTPTYQPAPRIPTLWEKVLNRVRSEIAATGGLSGEKTLSGLDMSCWLGTVDRETVLKTAVASSFIELKTTAGSKLADTGGEQILQLQAMINALECVPQLYVLTHLHDEEAFARLRHEGTEILKQAQENGVTSHMVTRAQLAEQDLRILTCQAHQRLARAEGEMLRETTEETLQQLGYTLSTRGNALRALRGTTCIWIEINERGQMSLDVSGFSGLSCQTEIKALENGLSERGIELKRTTSEIHCQKEGGHLATNLTSIFGSQPETPAQNITSLWGKPSDSQTNSQTNKNEHQTFNQIKESR